MSELMPYGASNLELSKKDARIQNQALTRLGAKSEIEMAKIEANAQLMAHKAAAVSYVAGRAMQEATNLSQMEQQLATLTPLVTTRLQGIADAASLALVNIIFEAQSVGGFR